MKRLLLGLCMAAGLGLAGCEKSIESEAKDVQDAQREAAKEVREEQRDVQDAAMEGAKKVNEEQRELEDAKTRETEQNPPPPVTPPTP